MRNDRFVAHVRCHVVNSALGGQDGSCVPPSHITECVAADPSRADTTDARGPVVHRRGIKYSSVFTSALSRFAHPHPRRCGERGKQLFPAPVCFGPRSGAQPTGAVNEPLSAAASRARLGSALLTISRWRRALPAGSCPPRPALRLGPGDVASRGESDRSADTRS